MYYYKCLTHYLQLGMLNTINRYKDKGAYVVISLQYREITVCVSTVDNRCAMELKDVLGNLHE